MMWKSVSFYLCVAAKVKCQEKHQDKRQAKSKKSNKTVVTLELFCLLNQPLFFSPLPSLECAPASSNEETWCASPQSPPWFRKY